MRYYEVKVFDEANRERTYQVLSESENAARLSAFVMDREHRGRRLGKKIDNFIRNSTRVVADRAMETDPLYFT